MPEFRSVLRFSLVGLLNTAVDLSIFNLLIHLFLPSSTSTLALCNAAAFSAALVSSYLGNRYWTFAHTSSPSSRRILLYILVSITAALLNTGIVVGATHLLVRFTGLAPWLQFNGAKLLATGVSMTWNFVLYKRLVFSIPASAPLTRAEQKTNGPEEVR